MIRIVGAALIFGGCGFFGFAMAAAHRQEERDLTDLLASLEYMSCELSFRQRDLPSLCRSAAWGRRETVGSFFLTLAQHLETQSAPAVSGCVAMAMENVHRPESVDRVLRQLGSTLGSFDLPGQLRGLESSIQAAQTELRRVRDGAANRRRSYQTLGLCAGAALAILFV